MWLRSFFSSMGVAAFAIVVLGCTGAVTPSGTGGGGGGGSTAEGEGGAGGQATCASYSGDGCTPGETESCSVPVVDMWGVDCQVQGTMTCNLVGPCDTAWNPPRSACECATPLVLSFDGAPVEYLADREHAFDLNGARSQVTDWPTARTPWLALDRDGSGRIEDGSELFGSMTVLSGGRRAPNGFAALRELDANGDGRITADDPGFARLLVWSDRDGDRVSSSGELQPVDALGVVSIDLAYTIEPRCDARGNCEVERASFRYVDARGVERRGAVVDVHLAAQR